METAVRLVNEAAELAGLPILDDSATVAYKSGEGQPQVRLRRHTSCSPRKSRAGSCLVVRWRERRHPTGVWLDAMEGPSAGGTKPASLRSNQNLVTCPSGRVGTQATCLLLRTSELKMRMAILSQEELMRCGRKLRSQQMSIIRQKLEIRH